MNRATKISQPRIMSNIVVFEPTMNIEEVKRDALKRAIHACLEKSSEDPSYLAKAKALENELKLMVKVEEESTWVSKLKRKVINFLVLISDQD